MSYTAVTKMRSHRYPLMGLGCGCTTGMGALETPSWPVIVGGLTVLGVLAFGVRAAMRKNRRRRSRR